MSYIKKLKQRYRKVKYVRVIEMPPLIMGTFGDNGIKKFFIYEESRKTLISWRYNWEMRDIFSKDKNGQYKRLIPFLRRWKII